MKRICTIGARGGSKGVPGKNVRPLMGKPLISHTIEQALNCDIFDAVAVSSDSQDILEIARRCGVPYLINRPPEMATDEVDKMPATIHCVKAVEKQTQLVFDTMIDLDATAPLRINEDIVNAVRLLEEQGLSNVFSVCPSRRSPYFNMVELDERGYARLSKSLGKTIFRRQDAPKSYDMNASIYVWRRDSFFSDTNGLFLNKTGIYIMPPERSIDIDSELDFAMVEFLFPRLI
jgi:CMP-N,N'-diacetyllegionaminic acid synthase